MAGALPQVTGKQLIRLLRLDGWASPRKSTHGRFFVKTSPDGTVRHTVVPDKPRPLRPTTLGQILGPLQTDLGRTGLAALIERHGLK
jgi:predicted RNA binding protein YcfA (HicA-like mRNA interferase family)